MLSLPKAESFIEKLSVIKQDELNIKGYPKTYLNHLLIHLDYYVRIYQQIIDLAAASAKKDISSLTILDFGSGNGLLGMFAKHLGCKKVWLCDVAPDFVEASKVTAHKANIEIDGFVTGDIVAVREYFQKQGVKPDIVLSTDVIEHIYNLDHLFKNLKQLNSGLISVFTTASNPYNFWKVRELHKIQCKEEWFGYNDLSKEVLEEKGLSNRSFFEQRKNIIRNTFIQIPENTVAELARRTRGKIAEDILASVRDYLESGVLPNPPADVYWVCDPYSGSWTERILPLMTYRELALHLGFRLHWCNGFYNPSSKSFALAFVTKAVNRLMKFQKQLGKYFAPYIVLLYLPVEAQAHKAT